MVLVLTLVLAVLGVGALLVAAYSAWRITQLVKTADRRRVLGFLGRWEFGAIRHFGGEPTIRHSNRYLNAMMVLLGAIVCAIIFSAVRFIDSQNGGPPDLSLGHLTAKTSSPSVLES